LALILSGTFDTLIAISSFLLVAVYLSGFVALLVLRKREPVLERPFKTWGYPWTTIAVLVASAGFLIASVATDAKHTLMTLMLIAFSYPLYRLSVKRRLASAANSS
jgi:APA family basic amino acid/polyamine antiporter